MSGITNSELLKVGGFRACWLQENDHLLDWVSMLAVYSYPVVEHPQRQGRGRCGYRLEFQVQDFLELWQEV